MVALIWAATDSHPTKLYLHRMIKRQVVITGIGVISALGLNKDGFWNGLIIGRCGIAEIDLFDVSNYRTKTGAQIRGFNPEDYFDKRGIQRMSRCDLIGVAAAREAVKDSLLNLNKEDKSRIGVILGGGAGGMLSVEEYRRGLYFGKRPRPSLLIPYSPSVTTDYIALEFGVNGPRATIATACSSSSTSVGYAMDLIRHNEADIVITGGSDAMCELTYAGFNSLRAVDPDKCKPFDANRKGLSLGEAAAILILEDINHAKKRGAKIYAEMAGYGIACDAFHMTAPDSSGSGAARTIKAALLDSGVNPSDVDYINAHGTATYHNDIAETKAIKTVFGEYAYKVPISSIKSMIGHCLGAAGGIEAAATALTIYNGIIPPTINYSTADPNCDLDYVPNKARNKEVDIAISNSLAFGGNNTTIVLKRYK